jgi:hypothetical protein
MPDPAAVTSDGKAAKAASAPAAAQRNPVPDGDTTLSGAELTGTVKGFWGFDSLTGPTMGLQETPGKDWKLAGDDPVIAGRNQHIVIGSTGTACIESIELEPAAADKAKLAWKGADKPNEIDMTLEVPARDAGAVHLAIRQYGEVTPATVSLVSYSPPTKLDALSFHAGDTMVRLSGTSLDQVRKVELGGVTFKRLEPAMDLLEELNGEASIRLVLAEGAKSPKGSAGESVAAQVSLSDGRVLPVTVSVEAARPHITLISKADMAAENAPASAFNIRLASKDDAAVSDTLVFSLKSSRQFPRAGRIEVASPDDSLHASFSLSDATPSLILESPDTLLASLQPLKAFGPSAFGPIRARAVAPDGSAGDWLPLVTLVRLPTLTRLNCPVAAPVAPAVHLKGAKLPAASVAAAAATIPDTASPALPAAVAAPDAAGSAAGAASPSTESEADGDASSVAGTSISASGAQAATCTLSGSSLYFIDSISTNEAFTNPTRVPEGFVGSSIDVPPPTGGDYYLRLRDDPSHVDTVALPAGPL